MSAKHTLFSYPRGQDNAALYAAMRVTIDGLNRMVTQLGAIESIDVSALQTSLASAVAAIDALTAQIEAITYTSNGVTVSGIDDVLGAISADVLDTIATVEGHTVDIADNTAAITTEQSARIAEDGNLASQISTISADLATANAAIVTEQTARADGDSANASSISSVSSTVSGHTSSITSLTSSVNGYASRWSISLTAQNYVTGLVQLSGSGTLSKFTVVASTFQIAQPSVTGGTPTPIFTIGKVNAVTKLGLRGDAIIDGTITARAVAAGSITADRLFVSALSTITGNIGTLYAGKIQDKPTAPTTTFDVALQKWSNSAGSYIDMKNGKWLFKGK